MIVQYRPITYIKIRVPFQAIFKDSSQKTHSHTFRTHFEYQAGQSIQ